MAELEVEHLRLSFGGLTVLDGISFTVEPAELFVLIGPNGAGKTSVFNCISGIYPGKGRILFKGRDITRWSPRARAKLGIARTFQHSELFPHMNVLDNIMVGRHARIDTRPWAEALSTPGVRRAEIAHRAAIERIIEFVELEGVRYADAGSLPFGTQKIVGLARALALEPSLLLLDEPSAGLSRDERDDLARFILRIKHELKLPMIWIEHDMQMVADLADRIHVLDYGRTLASGDPQSVLSNEAVINAYLGKA
ncbi:MAG: ABC transporter ATP-binding protein [Hyphomicrobiaceae bacterium]|nr:MAG: ABC transporter ATP-binding protein [Hyphomicrobiaceae bacterium]